MSCGGPGVLNEMQERFPLLKLDVHKYIWYQLSEVEGLKYYQPIAHSYDYSIYI